jgi:hypothetical protein
VNSHDVERALVQSRLDLADARLAQTAAEMATELDLYRDDWSTRTAEMMWAHEDRVRQIRDDQAAWLDSFINGETGEVSHTDVGQGQVVLGAPATGWSSPAGPGGPGPGQPPNPHAVELAEAERLRDLTMAEYAAERQRLIRSNQGMF